MKVLVEPHNLAWDAEFARIRDQLKEILTGIPTISIEHVGSTSIPGLLAKPVLDIDIVIREENLTRTRAKMVAAEYMDLGEMGVPGRFAFRQPGFAREAVGGLLEEDLDGGKKQKEMRRNTYVVVEGCLALRNHLDLKRILLEDENLRNEYSEVKLRLAERDLENVDEYCKGKNGILLRVLGRAGWSEEELEEVRKANE